MKNIMDLSRLKRAVFSSLMSIFMVVSIAAQDKDVASDASLTVKGKVCDAHTKEPIVAAQIGVLNYNASATTDENGAFSIEVKNSSDVLIVKAYDYNLREFPVRGNDEVVIYLYSNAFSENYYSLNTTKGDISNTHINMAISQKSELNTVNSLSADDIIQNSLGGDVRSVSRSGVPAMGNAMFIRGNNSVNSNAQPLFVIDGVIWTDFYSKPTAQVGYYANPLAFIDVNDIESIQVLKNGTSIYGSKGANGVILINTKKADGIVTKLSANASYGVVSEPRSIPVMDADEYRIYLSDLLGTVEGTSAKNFSDLVYFNDDKSELSYPTYHNSTNWNDEVYQEGVTENYNINVRGGDSRALYYFTLSYAGAEGVVKNTSMERLGTRVNADFDLAEIFKLGLNLGFTNVDRDLQDNGITPYSSPAFLSMVKAPFLSPYIYSLNGDLTDKVADGDIFGVGNPTAILKNSINTTSNQRFNVGAKPTFILTPNLKWSNLFDFSTDKAEEFYFSPMQGRVSLLSKDNEILENIAATQFYRNSTIFNESQLTYEKKIGDHSIYAVAGTRFMRNLFEADYASGYNTGSDEISVVSSSLLYLTPEGESPISKTISNYLQFDYNFANKYFVTATAAMDASNKLGLEVDGDIDFLGTQWGLFPSIEAGWLVSSEPFMSSLNVINYLKLRANYGISGNDDIPMNANTTYFNMVSYINEAQGGVLTGLANNSINWETTSSAGVGIDLSLFNERINVSFDAYQSTTKDLLTIKSLPDVTGIDEYYWINGGDMENKGYEISANLKLLNLSNFKWEVGANIGHYENKITSIPNGGMYTNTYEGTVLTDVGNAAGVFYGYKTAGVFSTTEAAEAANLKLIDSEGEILNFKAGDLIFEDVEKDGYIDSNDKQVIGDPNPDFYGNFSSSVSVKGFKLGAVFTFSKGNDIYNYLRRNLEMGSNLYNQSTAMLARWQTEGQITTMPKSVYDDPMGNSRFSDRWIEDGSYLKLKTLTLSYDVPLKGSFIEGINVWVSANNLWTLTDYLGQDPEVYSGNSVLMQGIDTGMLPVTKSYFIGVRLDL